MWHGTVAGHLADNKREESPCASTLISGPIVVIALTLILFIVALFIQGLTHELLLEAGVFLVSVKLILMSYKNSVLAGETGSAWSKSTICCARWEIRFRFLKPATEPFVLPGAPG